MRADIVEAIHALDAAAAAARATARAQQSEAWQEFAVMLSGLCAQLTAAAAANGHTGLLAGSDRQPAPLSTELASAARLLSSMDRPEGVQARTWATLVLRVQTASRDARMVTPSTAGAR